MEHKGTTPLETERLLLRPFRPTDGDAAFRNWMGDPAVTRYLTWPAHESPAVSREVVCQWCARYEAPEFYLWAIVPKDLGEPVGSISVVGQNEAVSELEIGYCMGRAWWGKGLMAEALRAVIVFLFTEVGANRITARHDVNNPNSGRVMQKAGMTLEGVLRQGGKNNQGICDTAIYGILAEDWAPVHAILQD